MRSLRGLVAGSHALKGLFLSGRAAPLLVPTVAGGTLSGQGRGSGRGAGAARVTAALGFLAATGMTAADADEGVPSPPVAARRPHVVRLGKVSGEYRGDEEALLDPPRELVDALFWLRDDKRESEEVLEHLRKENAYTEAMTKHLEAFRERLYQELLSHLKETDVSAAYGHGPFEYYTRTTEGLSYVCHCRRPRGAGTRAEQVVLDENEVAKSYPKHCDVGSVEVSPDHKLLAWSLDASGGETYTMHFKDLTTGEVLADTLEKTTGDVCWGADRRTVFYSTFDDVHRPCAVWRHTLGTSQAEDEKLYEDMDGLYYVSFDKSRDGRLLFVSSDSSETSEVHMLPLADSQGRPVEDGEGGAGKRLRVIHPREHKLRYGVDHRAGWLFITTNEGGATNEKIVVTPAAQPAKEHWQPLRASSGEPVLPHDARRTVAYATCFRDHVVVVGREEGLSQVWVLAMDGQTPAVRDVHRIEWPDAAYHCGLGPNMETSASTLRLRYSSPVTPPRALDYDMSSRTFRVVKAAAVPNYDASLYATARHEVEARDGTKVPVTLLWRTDKVPMDGNVPASPQRVHLYGYGSYGMSMEPSFSSSALPLLDRGIVYVVAHVRGGSEMGRAQWYEDGGKFLAKRNTFLDFVDVATHLVDAGWTGPGRMSCEGRSAGGLLVGAVINMAPHLFVAALAGVPFVDLMVTMADPSIPLTEGEWEEWGNPNAAEFFEYMLSYSPMDQIAAQVYPAVLALGGLHDPRVAYWEPAKWVQRLREKRTNDPTDGRAVLLKMDLDAGHFSATDRYKHLRLLAFDYAWLLDQHCLADE